MSTVTEPWLTAEQYALLPDNGQPTELVRGCVVGGEWNTPGRGYFCANVGRILGNFVQRHDLGRVTNNCGVITGRDPDTVRGADVCFFSYERLTRGPMPAGYLPVPP